MKSKIIVRIFGGLGNQLFCYAAARRLALINNAELVIDDVSGFLYDHTYRRNYQLDHFNISCRKASRQERLEPLSKIRRFLKRKWNQFKPFELRNYLTQDGVDFDRRLLDLSPKGVVFIEGNWQSECYFKDFEEVIRQDLVIIPPYDVTNLSMAIQMKNCNSVSLHVRFFDGPGSTGAYKLNHEYYVEAIKSMEDLVPGAHYFIFSDYPEVAKKEIPLPDHRVTLVNCNQGDDLAYADLWLMTQCQHFVIANSTFSWWGAWLAANPTKVVIAPASKIGSVDQITAWGFDGLIPKNWILK